MHEHIARTLYYINIHLLYASIVGLAAWALTSIRGGSATMKYWIWVAGSFNFIVPMGAVLDKSWPSHLAWARPLGVIGDFANTVSQGWVAVTLSVAWLLGASLMFTRLWLRLHADRRDAAAVRSLHLARPDFVAHGVPVRFADSGYAPAVDGVLHPYISLPNGIDRLLSEQELNAVLIHEVTHARRHDNLIRLMHEMSLCVLWFHPLVWLASSRLALYRELSCDELVIQSSCGGELVSALSKLANTEQTLLLQASATSLIRHRLARLSAPPQPARHAAGLALSVMFAAVLFWGIWGTVSHTACCFLAKR
jgi:beta-lactamase regulating signal transducer with metallopeptidase domain